MKKRLVFFLALGLALAAVAPLVPHSHGGDDDHSQHADCPLYRLHQNPAQAIEPLDARLHAEPALFGAFIPGAHCYRFQTLLHSNSLRAPPVFS